jgi:methyl-accepting chemotaxis protein
MTVVDPACTNATPFRRKLATTILLAGLLPLLAASVVAFVLARGALKDSAENRQLLMRDEKKGAVIRYFEDAAASVRLLATAPGPREQLAALGEAFSRLPEEMGWGKAGGAPLEAEAARRMDEAVTALARLHSEVPAAGARGAVVSSLPEDSAARAAQVLFLLRNPHPTGSRHVLERPAEGTTAFGDAHAKVHGFLGAYVRENGFDDLMFVEARGGTVVYTWAKELDFGASVKVGEVAKTGFARAARRAMETAGTQTVVAEDFEAYGPAGGKPSAFLACGVRAGGAAVGAVVVRIGVETLNRIVAPEPSAVASAETYIVGADKIMRTQSRFETASTVLKKQIDSPAVSRSLAGESEVTEAPDYRGVDSVVAYAPLDVVGLHYGIVRKVDAADAFAPVRKLLLWMAVLAGVLVVLALVASIVLGRSLAQPVSRVTDRLEGMAQSLLSTAQEQQAGAAESAAAVEETRQTFQGVLGAAQNLRQVGTEVLSSAEVSQRNAQTIGHRIRELSDSTARIGEILAIVKEIANRSDLLALNAALEGTKAGEAGRGFSLVATQMQRLAEEVMGSAKKIEGLTQDITRSSAGAVLAAEEADKVASHTTQSAQHIAEAVQTQQGATEQVSVAMNEIASVARQSVDASRTIVESANHLLGVAQDLRRILGTKA